MKQKFNVENWEYAFIAVSIIAILFTHTYISGRQVENIIEGICLGIIATVFLLIIQRWKHEADLEKYYSTLIGKYERIEIGQDNTEIETTHKLWSDNVGLPMSIEYTGKHTIKITAGYWKNDVVEATVHFTDENRYIGNGMYSYIKTDIRGDYDHTGHKGTYTVFRQYDSMDLLVLYQHIYPRTQPLNPDKNKGWQIFKKIG